jgi:RecB family exonuclease
MDDQGRLVVVDLKTGSSAPSAEDTAEHAQLAAYQVAVEAGVFPRATSRGAPRSWPGLGPTSAVSAAGSARRREDSGVGRAMVRRAAKAMAASTFTAVVNDGCRHCPVRTSCPSPARDGR